MRVEPATARRPGRALSRVAAVLLVSLAAVACGRQNAAVQSRQVAASLRAHAPPANLPTLAPMLARVSPAVVNISVQGTVQVAENPAFQDPMFRQFFGLQEQPETEHFQAVGSGVVIDAARGLIVTNNHVVRNAQQIQVTLKDRRQRSAKLIGADPQTDIAILQIDAGNLKGIPLGTSRDLRVGDYVVAIGDPFGIGQTATFGIVSALGRTGLGIENYEDFIQTDASINPGNSGGALVNMAGQLIGMNTAILSQSGGNVGVGFAIPVDMVRTIARELIQSGKISRGALGVTIQDLTPRLARAMGMKISSGALVSQVHANSAAAKADVRSGDVITRLNGIAIANSNDLRNAVGEESPGTEVTLTLLRGGKEQKIDVRLEALTVAANDSAPTAQTSQGKRLLSGVTLGAIPQSNPDYGTATGTYVENVVPGSAAATAGLQPGDIIIEADRMPVTSTSDLDRILHGRAAGNPLLLQVERGNSTLFLAIG
ncbi:MAG TPA: DegQ family serine endoprotease [Rhizomicrobium sp.]|jgi:Do/DeqQ family serine protease|nr:DegQ family serine endoprotease [Rhizomicrobium sp.]